mmetsp:Transcript_17126/g.57665  ORF Transcript_17126/g.57665 Transcript_17126/m.57665 type:complete len:100 (+) Transcript_17126:231-530(+)
MQAQHCDLVADALNSACLEESGGAASSSLERLLRQLVATHAAIRRATLDCGDNFRLEVPGRPAARASSPVSARSNGESSSSTAASASQLSLGSPSNGAQ